MNKSWIILLAFVLLFGWLIWTSSRTGQVVCDACITFEGHTECAKAAAPTRERAIMEAATVICSKIGGGMSEGIRCRGTEPDKVECTGKAAAGKGKY